MNHGFSHDYATARDRFVAAAVSAGGQLDALAIDDRGPRGESLSIDVASFGAERPRRAIVHACGTHGIEGFAGSAVQLALLQNLPDLPDDLALVLIHAVNPYGMAWLRRFNEHNVDLNRNALPLGENYAGAAEAYRNLDPLLNPLGPPRRLDLFWGQAAWAIARYGFANLKQAIAEGQYEYPEGIFFGGAQLESSTRQVLNWLAAHLEPVESGVFIDVHTGLGVSGDDLLLVTLATESPEFARVREQFGAKVTGSTRDSAAYEVRGDLTRAVARRLAQGSWTSLCQEFGTYKPVQVLKALIDENRFHRFGPRDEMDHRVKRRLREMFCPASEIWRQAVVNRGVQLVRQAIDVCG